VERHGLFVTAPRDGVEQAEAVETPEEILRAGDHHGATYFQHQGFAQMLRAGGSPDVTLEDGRIWIRGQIIDEENAENQEQKISTAYYFVNEATEGIEIPMEDNGSFLISFSIYFLNGDVTILFEAIDISGNKGTHQLTLLDVSQPTDEPDDTPMPTAGPTETPLPAPTSGPTETPVPTSAPSPGTLWFDPGEVVVSVGQNFSTKIRLNSGGHRMAAYGMNLYYDFLLLEVGSTAGNHGIEAGPDGFLTAVNTNSPGLFVLSGFDASGTGPGLDLHILTSSWGALNPGSSLISLRIINLVSPDGTAIGEPVSHDCRVIVNE
jgi:hypothetical protein